MNRCAQRTLATAAIATLTMAAAVMPAVADEATTGPFGGHGGHTTSAPVATPEPSAPAGAPSHAGEDAHAPGMNHGAPSPAATTAPADHEDMPGMDHAGTPGSTASAGDGSDQESHGTQHGTTSGEEHSSTPGDQGSPAGEHETGSAGGHDAPAAEPTNRGPVLFSFAGVNLAVLGAAWVLRRKNGAQRKRRASASRCPRPQPLS